MAGLASWHNHESRDTAGPPAGWLGTLWAVPRSRWTWIAAGYWVVFLVTQAILPTGTTLDASNSAA